jgi:hypothetical protein
VNGRGPTINASPSGSSPPRNMQTMNDTKRIVVSL